jgi:hypothetical protein
MTLSRQKLREITQLLFCDNDRELQIVEIKVICLGDHENCLTIGSLKSVD